MGDVSRALLLPDVQSPSDGLLKTLAIYWDELVVPDYTERAVGSEESEFQETTDDFVAFEGNGVVRRWERTIELPPLDFSDLPSSYRFDDHDGISTEDYGIDLDGKGLTRAARLFLLPMLEAIPDRSEVKPGEVTRYLDEHPAIAEMAVERSLETIMSYTAEHYLSRMRDAFGLSSEHHLAPLARSPISHIASIVGAPAGAPRSEAALLSAAIQAFAVDPSTPIERIMRFREKNQASLGRFRASLTDLSEGLRQDDNPTHLLANARDIYRNRVVPALGDLEAVLSEGRIRFFVKSLLGATAVAMAPVDPTKAVDGGVTLIGQTLNYSFSREKMIREHPFGYLHQVSADLPSTSPRPSTATLALTIEKPAEQIQKMLLPQVGVAMRKLFWTDEVHTQARLLDERNSTDPGSRSTEPPT